MNVIRYHNLVNLLILYSYLLKCWSQFCNRVVMKCKYRVRWFSSKGAFLVLLWTLLIVISCASIKNILINFYYHIKQRNAPSEWILAIPIVISTVVSAPLSGWLADSKFGNYRVFRVGTVLLFLSTVINCLCMILKQLVWENNDVLKWIHLCLTGTIFVIGACACFVTSLPLGLDQMPDASSSSITSYIAWFGCSFFFGNFFADWLNLFMSKCELQQSFYLVSSLVPTFILSILVSSNFLCSPKWLIIEPKSPQCLKTIYRVLEFAVKHKAPLNRSAFTYWEEEIPSRIDLAKSKYGGPFTTEQVEDVKTVLRLMVIYLPILVAYFSFVIRAITVKGEDFSGSTFTSCTQHALSNFIYITSLYSILGTICYELLLFPLIGSKIPSILKRIGIVSLAVTLFSFLCLVVMLANYLSHLNEDISGWIVCLVYHITSGLLTQVLTTAILEFVCAQSPYNMRGMLVSLFFPFLLLLGVAGWVFISALKDYACGVQSWCSLLPYSVKALVSLTGFLLFCVAAYWYKRRVRDEDYSAQRVVEEVYDRYLTAAAAQSKSYGAGD